VAPASQDALYGNWSDCRDCFLHGTGGAPLFLGIIKLVNLKSFVPDFETGKDTATKELSFKCQEISLFKH